LLARILIFPPTQKPFIIAWSLWRRRHQAAATICHYKRHLQSATVVLSLLRDDSHCERGDKQ
ncbi:hypothetical protein NKH61_34555, partial [Mesorhizobium sp. M1005]